MTTELTPSEIRGAITAARDEISRFLCDLISFPSLSGQEAEVMNYAARRFSEVAEVEAIPLEDSLREDEDYSDPIPGLHYDGRSNLRLRVAGQAGGRSLLFNTHLDVVPASAGQDRPFEPTVEEGVVRGRGACDAKGQAATLFATLLALKELRLTPRGDVLGHLVVEEENGGNGSLAMVRRGERADACIVLEPTCLKIISSARGAIWFRVTCHGKPGHSGHPGSSISALKMAIQVIRILENYHARLLESSRDIPLFDQFPNPMPINFGKLAAGDWPATAPSQAVVEGVLGLLPNKTRGEVMGEMKRAILDEGDEWLRGYFEIDFTYRHDSHVIDPAHPLVQELQASCRSAGMATEVAALTASADSWLYNNQLKIPTVIFGPGEIRWAHAKEEQIRLADIETAATMMTEFIGRWCGFKEIS